jgi:DNA invertase Pin-like site-specific DNA recombinase
MKVAIYVRVSTEDQSTDKQEAMCLDYCARNSHEVFATYKDVISGTKTSREQFDMLLADMRSNRFSGIVVTKLDRIGRSLQHILSLFDEFNKRGVAFIATTQNIDTGSSAGKLQMQIMGAFAEFERNIISERTKEALKGNDKVGKRGPDKKARKQRGVQKPRIKYGFER